MKKKLTAIFLCVALVAIAIVGASLAYFTDTDSAQNTFTVGNVKIQLLESQYHRVNAGRGNAIGQTEPLMGGYLWAADVDMQGTPENTPTTLPPMKFGMGSISPMLKSKPMQQATKRLFCRAQPEHGSRC